jgi:hypothetical protein
MNDLLNRDWSYDEEQRHQCEVRQLLKWRKEWGLQRFQRYLQTAGFDSRRAKLREDIADQWKKGNRGEERDWQ